MMHETTHTRLLPFVRRQRGRWSSLPSRNQLAATKQENSRQTNYITISGQPHFPRNYNMKRHELQYELLALLFGV